MNVKELKQLIANLDDDDVEVITKSGNFELRGAKVRAQAAVTKQTKIRESFRDAFDGTDYEKEVYVHSEEGKETLMIF